jgi:hypothetical protein
MKPDDNQLLDKMWDYPLFEAFARRRAYRFGLGTELKQTPFPFKSEHAPVALSEVETAGLCWAGYGVTGLINGDLECSNNTFMNWQGRTVPAPCNDQHNELLFINDDGVFLYRPQPANKVTEIGSPADRGKILDSYRDGAVQMIKGRPDLPPASVLAMNYWNFNKPGQTTFFPIIDLTFEYINALFVYFCDDHYSIIDDMRGGVPAGIGKWIDNGFLSGPKVALSFNDISILSFTSGIGHYMVQNINLAATSLGLGSFVWGGYVPLVLLGGTPLAQGFGFRFQTDKNGMPYPAGKDGFVQPLVPPYVKDMDEAVDRVLEYKFGKGGLFAADYPRDKSFSDPSIATRVDHPSKEGIECVKAFCRYIVDTYGRFPALVDPIALPAAVTVHHVDFDFYEKYYKPEVVTATQREHLKNWHGVE